MPTIRSQARKVGVQAGTQRAVSCHSCHMCFGNVSADDECVVPLRHCTVPKPHPQGSDATQLEDLHDTETCRA